MPEPPPFAFSDGDSFQVHVHRTEASLQVDGRERLWGLHVYRLVGRVNGQSVERVFTEQQLRVLRQRRLATRR